MIERISGNEVLGLPAATGHSPSRSVSSAPLIFRGYREVRHAIQQKAPRSRVLSRSRVSEEKVSRPKRASSAVTGSCEEIRSFSKSSAATIRVRAGQGGGFKRCCMLSGEFDGSDRDYFF